MSPPPTKVPADPALDRATEGARTDRGPDPAGPSTALRANEALVIDAQRAAGNRAVSSVVAGPPHGVQRAPNDDDPRRVSGMAHAPTLDPRPGPAPAVDSPMARATTAPPPQLQVTSQTLNTGAPGGAPDAPQLQVTSNTLVSGAPAPPGAGAPAPGGPQGPGPSGPRAQPLAPDQLPQSAKPFPFAPQWWQSDPRFAVGGEHGPKPVPPGMFGGAPKPVSKSSKPVEVTQAQAEAEFRKDPTRVIRSKDDNWHRDAWHHAKGFETHGEDKPPPRAFTDGSYYYVDPRYAGSATKLDVYAAVPKGPGAPAPGGTGSPAPGGTGGTGPAGTSGADGGFPRPLPGPVADRQPVDRMRQAVAPDTSFTGGPRGTQKAAPATHTEVRDALARDPSSVVRSPNARWHRQGYRLDGGGREAPGAFKVGKLYIIAPDYPNLPSVPKLGESAPPKPSTLPQAAQVVSLQGTQYDEKTAGRRYTSSAIQTGDRMEIRDQKRELTPIHAQRITGHEIQEGDLKKRTETKVGGGLGHGGNLIGAGAGRTETTTVGDNLGATKNVQANVGLTKDGQIAATIGTSKETVLGTTPTGDPLKKSSSTTGGATYDPLTDTVGVNAAHKVTGPSGTSKTVTGGATMDDKGSATVTAGLGVESKGGSSITTSLTAGTKVVAEEPVELPDGQYEVTYSITDSVGGAVGAGQRMGGTGAPSIGISGGASHGDFQGGSKRFKDKKAADAWRKDAGNRLRGEKAMAVHMPPTTVAGALMIPVGETRSTGEVDSTSMGISGSYGGTTLGYGKTESDTRSLTIRRTSAGTVEVTGSIIGTKQKDVSIAVPVLSNSKGGIESKSFAVTWAFDLSTPVGAVAFERYCKTGLPPIPGGVLRYIDKGASDEDHDNYKIPFLGTASWSGTTWEVSRENATGGFQKQFGGKQSHDVKPSKVAKLLGDDEVSSNAQIVRSSEDSVDKGAKAEFKVSGESGAFNKEEFGKIFMGAGGGAKASGEWKLSADVPLENIRALEKVSPELRNAASIDDRMRIYAELVKKNGARMLGGQVGMTSKAWNLELKGDDNFPGEKGRVRLNQLRKDLMAALKVKPDFANQIIRTTGEELEKLTRRRAAVADLTKYTDLPGGLRQQQLGVIDGHIEELKSVRRNAQAVAMKRIPGEKADDAVARVGKGEPDDATRKADREYAGLQTKVEAKEKQINVLRKDVHDFSKALGDAIGAKGTTALKFNVQSDVAQVHIGMAKSWIGQATAADKQQAALDPKIDELRNAWTAANDPKDRLAALKALDGVLGERVKLMQQTIHFVKEAGKAVFPITTKSAKAGNPYFWLSLGMVEEDAEARPAPTSMSL